MHRTKPPPSAPQPRVPPASARRAGVARCLAALSLSLGLGGGLAGCRGAYYDTIVRIKTADRPKLQYRLSVRHRSEEAPSWIYEVTVLRAGNAVAETLVELTGGLTLDEAVGQPWVKTHRHPDADAQRCLGSGDPGEGRPCEGTVIWIEVEGDEQKMFDDRSSLPPLTTLRRSIHAIFLKAKRHGSGTGAWRLDTAEVPLPL